VRVSGSAAVCAIAVLLATLAGCSFGGGAAPSPAAGGTSASPASIPELTRQAQKEKGLVIYANAPAQYFQPVITAFRKTHPTIKASVTTLADKTIFSRYEAEAAQGARTADLIVSSAPGAWVQGEQNGVTAGITPAGLAAFPSWVNQGHGVYVMSAEPNVLTYSPKLLKPHEVPKTWAELAAAAKANPAKYKMVSLTVDNPIEYSGIYGLLQILGDAKTWNYLDTLAPVTTNYAQALDGLTEILQGGASAGYMSSGLVQGVLPHYKGLIDIKFMQDATPLVPRGIAMTAKASSPASAQLFMDFLYTQAGQDALCGGGFEAIMNDYHPANGCTASLTALAEQVPLRSTYLVPISQAMTGRLDAITKRWNHAYHR
jgi:iron(III) transport system substrate-binding protein